MKITMLLIVSVLACNILGAAASNEKDNGRDYQCFYRAIERNDDTEIVLRVLRENKDRGLHDRYYYDTPLHQASRFGRVELACVFLERGANVNAKNVEGDTPLHLAARSGHEEFVKLLLQCDAKADEKNRFDETAAKVATIKGYHKLAHLITSWPMLKQLLHKNDKKEIEEPEGN